MFGNNSWWRHRGRHRHFYFTLNCPPVDRATLANIVGASFQKSRTAGAYSSASNFPSVGLCRSGLDFFARTSWDGFGLPTRSRAISRTILEAEKIFFLRLRGMVVMLASSHIQGHIRCPKVQ